MFANRFHPSRFETTNRSSRAKTQPAAKRRQDLVRQLNALKKEDDLYYKGDVAWLGHDASEDVIAFRRTFGSRQMWFAANLHRKPVAVRLKEPFPAAAERTIVSGAEMPEESLLLFAPHGFIMVCEQA